MSKRLFHYYTHTCVHTSVYPCTPLSINAHIHPSIDPSTCSSVRLSIHPSFSFPSSLSSLRPSIHPFFLLFPLPPSFPPSSQPFLQSLSPCNHPSTQLLTRIKTISHPSSGLVVMNIHEHLGQVNGMSWMILLPLAGVDKSQRHLVTVFGVVSASSPEPVTVQLFGSRSTAAAAIR